MRRLVAQRLLPLSLVLAWFLCGNPGQARAGYVIAGGDVLQPQHSLLDESPLDWAAPVEEASWANADPADASDPRAPDTDGTRGDNSTWWRWGMTLSRRLVYWAGGKPAPTGSDNPLSRADVLPAARHRTAGEGGASCVPAAVPGFRPILMKDRLLRPP